MSNHPILLVDFSAIYCRFALRMGAEEQVDLGARQTVGKIRGYSKSFKHIAICLDSRRNWRHEKLETYKAPESGEQQSQQANTTQNQGDKAPPDKEPAPQTPPPKRPRTRHVSM